MLTPEQASLIEQAERLDKDATLGPWVIEEWDRTQRHICSQAQKFVAQTLHRNDDNNSRFIAESRTLVPALAAELKRALEENAKLRDRLAKCEPVIELVRTFQTLNRQAIADGHTEWTEAEYDAMDMIAAATLPEVSP